MLLPCCDIIKILHEILETARMPLHLIATRTKILPDSLRECVARRRRRKVQYSSTSSRRGTLVAEFSIELE